MAIGPTVYKFAKQLRNRLAMVCIRRGFYQFGRRSILAMPFRSGNEHRISIGDGVFAGPGCWIEVVNDDDKGTHAIIVLEDGVSISGDCTITAVSQITIGKDALIARFVHISDHSHETGNPLLPIKSQGLTKVAPVSIGVGAWLGHGAVICPGVTVGKNAVVGANSVVRDDIPDGCVAVGAPARIISRPALNTLIPQV